MSFRSAAISGLMFLKENKNAVKWEWYADTIPIFNIKTSNKLKLPFQVNRDDYGTRPDLVYRISEL